MEKKNRKSSTFRIWTVRPVELSCRARRTPRQRLKLSNHFARDEAEKKEEDKHEKLVRCRGRKKKLKQSGVETEIRAQTERGNTTIMATPRRIVYINGPPHDYHFQIRPSYLATFLQLLHRPLSLPFVCSFFLFITWISIRIQRASQFAANYPIDIEWRSEDDMKANLVRFSSGIPSQIAQDKRGWLLDPVSLARASGISAGAVSCASIYVGEIRPGRLRGNHRDHNCNETFVIWGAATKFRVTKLLF